MILHITDGFDIRLDEFNPHTYNCHINIIKPYRGRQAIEACEKIINAIFEMTDKTKLVAFIPRSKRHVRLFVRQIGFTEEGCLTAFSAENKEDTFIYSYNKE